MPVVAVNAFADDTQAGWTVREAAIRAGAEDAVQRPLGRRWRRRERPGRAAVAAARSSEFSFYPLDMPIKRRPDHRHQGLRCGEWVQPRVRRIALFTRLMRCPADLCKAHLSLLMTLP